MMTESTVATTSNIVRAQELLHNLTEEGYRFYSTPNGPILRPAGAFPKQHQSDYAPEDASRLQELLMVSDDVCSLVSAASCLGFSLHLVEITAERDAVFAKEMPGYLFENVERVRASL